MSNKTRTPKDLEPRELLEVELATIPGLPLPGSPIFFSKYALDELACDEDALPNNGGLYFISRDEDEDGGLLKLYNGKTSCLSTLLAQHELNVWWAYQQAQDIWVYEENNRKMRRHIECAMLLWEGAQFAFFEDTYRHN